MKRKIAISVLVFIIIIGDIIFNYTGAVANAADSTNNIEYNQFYYKQLTSELAKQVYNGILNDKSGTGKFTIATNLSFKVKDFTDEQQEEKLQELYDKNISPDIHDAFCAFILDHPEYYWIRYNGIDGTIAPEVKYNINEGEVIITQLNMDLYVLPQVNDKQQFEVKLKEVANSITGKNEYEILKNIYNYVITNVSNENLNGEEIQQTAYGALMNNKASDEGISNLFTLLCKQKGIASTIIRGNIIGEETKMHQWSGVYVEEKWYAVDADLDNLDNTEDWFMVGNNTVIGDKKFSELLVANIKPYEEQKTTFQEPILTNNQYEELKLTVEYSTTETTKEGVIVTINANKEINPIDGWTISEDKMHLQREFLENISGILTVTSIYGEKINEKITIANIDTALPNVTVEYSNSEQGVSEVTVTIKSDRKLKELEGWNLSEDKKFLTKTYYQNTTETVTVTDVLSNVVPVEIIINNIKEEAPKCTVSYSTIEQTNKNIIVTIGSNKELKPVKGWTLGKDKKKLTKEYEKNTNEEIEVEDIHGNKIRVIIEINNIDKEVPNAEVSYSTTEPTNDKVKVYIKAKEKLQKIEGWEISADGYTISRYYFENQLENIKIKDLAGNEFETKVIIKNIDKDKPICKVEYETTEEGITVKVIANEKLQALNGWNLSSDKKVLTKTYKENKKEVLEIKDLAGNVAETAISVTTIKNEADNQNVNTEDGNKEKDFLNKIKELPKAGKLNLVFIVIIMLIITAICFYKYKHYNRYSKYLKKK